MSLPPSPPDSPAPVPERIAELLGPSGATLFAEIELELAPIKERLVAAGLGGLDSLLPAIPHLPPSEAS